MSDNIFEALKSLSKNCDLVMQKVDKGNSVVIVKKHVYLRHIGTTLSNHIISLKKLISKKEF